MIRTASRPNSAIDNLFITQWGSEVFTAYLRKGSRLRGTVCEKTINPGDTAKFPKYGTGSVRKIAAKLEVGVATVHRVLTGRHISQGAHNSRARLQAQGAAE